ncbi:hypothetical protein CPB84DRAFT_1763121 [Gymnopilus junonius]|uniref:Uncharacterized protein n=1 Tax=Gymnopilus junonius TaxID=109634 RepID=A0A9P5NYM0_GYMJU|nr:hypothetical protein CPB84DRAFT_1763121 [Gymnopilus junonius]
MFLPEVEIASDLIRDQLTEEAALYRELEHFDPYSGNLLEYLEPHGAPTSAYLVFPTGEINTHLNISNINSLQAGQVNFRPSAVPVYTFPTPIQQIVAFNDHDVNLAVRTYSTTQFLSLKWQSDAGEGVSVTEFASLSSADTAGDAVVDVNMLPFSAGVLLVSDTGTVLKCQFGDGRKEINPVHRSYLSAPLIDQEFWRLSTGESLYTYSVMSSEKVWQHDIRTDTAQEVLSISGGKHCLTSMEDHGSDSTFCVSSTSQIIWMDRRFLNKPLLAYCHGRDYDRYLTVNTLQSALNKPLTFLTTRNNALTTIYDVSRSSESLVTLNTLPFALSQERSVYRKNVGRKFIRGETLGLARLSERGSVEYTELVSDLDPQIHYIVNFPPEIEKLAAASANIHTDIGPRGLREFSQVDLRPAYDALFRRHFQEAKVMEDEQAEATYQQIEHFPSYMQIKEAPADHMLTTYDIAYRAGAEPHSTSRADFLTESLVNSKRGYRALKQGRLFPHLVKAQWHRTILPTLRKLDKHFPVDPIQSMEYAQRFNLTDTEGRPTTCRQYEQEACEQLTLDLTLASDIFSDTPFSRLGQTLEVMTEALSLGDEPPPVEFEYLKPQKKFAATVPGDGKSDAPELPMGVRLLLKEWDTTSLEPSKDSKPALPNQRRHVKCESQRPPQIMASSCAGQVVADMARIPIAKVQSQEYFSSRNAGVHDSLPVSFSQDLNASTQILPGPHGGRPGVKKKPAKKRLGGF